MRIVDDIVNKHDGEMEIEVNDTVHITILLDVL